MPGVLGIGRQEPVEQRERLVTPVKSDELFGGTLGEPVGQFAAFEQPVKLPLRFGLVAFEQALVDFLPQERDSEAGGALLIPSPLDQCCGSLLDFLENVRLRESGGKEV
jgi:hypothetical protein